MFIILIQTKYGVTIVKRFFREDHTWPHSWFSDVFLPRFSTSENCLHWYFVIERRFYLLNKSKINGIFLKLYAKVNCLVEISFRDFWPVYFLFQLLDFNKHESMSHMIHNVFCTLASLAAAIKFYVKLAFSIVQMQDIPRADTMKNLDISFFHKISSVSLKFKGQWIFVFKRNKIQLKLLQTWI